MAAQIAIATENSHGPAPQGKLANNGLAPSSPRIAGKHEFSTGLLSMLAVLAGTRAEMPAPSTSGSSTGHEPIPASPTPNEKELPAPGKESRTVVPMPDLAKRPVHHKVSPPVQPGLSGAPTAIKGLDTTRSAELTDTTVGPKRTKIALAVNLSDSSSGPLTIPLNPATNMVHAERVQSPAATQVPQHETASNSNFARNAQIVHDPAAMAPKPAAFAATPGESATSQLAPTAPSDESALAPHSTWPALPEHVVPRTESAPAPAGLLPSPKLKLPAANSLNPLFNSVASLDSGSNPSLSRPISSVQATGRASRSATRSSGADSTIDLSIMHAPTQGAITSYIANSIPARDAALLDRQSNPSSAHPSASPAATLDRDAFAALDKATGGPETTWIHAGAHHAEAGYLDPSLGWVTVRADGTSGGVHAALIPGSSEAASALSNQLAGLNAFMADHQGHSATVTLASPDSGSSHAGTAQQDNSMNGQHNQQPQQDRNPSVPFTRDSNPSSDWLDRDNAAAGTLFQGPNVTNGSGVHLSVMA